MLIIIPLGGIGKRFSDEGYSQPKCLVKVLGKPIIFWVIDCLIKSIDFNNDNDILLIVYNKMLDAYNLQTIIQDVYPHIKFVSVDNTRGAVETLKYGIEYIKTTHETVYDSGRNVMCVDGDTVYMCDIVDIYKKLPEHKKNCVFCFHSTTPEPIYSYISCDVDNKITQIIEKVKISDFANTGCYCFSDIRKFYTHCCHLLTNNITQKGEFYTSGVIANMLKETTTEQPEVSYVIHNDISNHFNNRFYGVCLSESDIEVLGTPHQVKIFSSKFLDKSEKMRFCFDLDNTLVTRPDIDKDYTTVKGITRNISMVRYLHSLGHYIIICTARKMKTYNGNVGMVVKDAGEIVIDTLKKFDIPYNELHFGKPYANYYIDDLAINAFNDIQKELGFYIEQTNSIKERDFNHILYKDNTVIKSSKYKLDGEIHWYMHIPLSISHLFPKMISYDSKHYKEYIVEKIDGILVSTMFVNENLSLHLLQNILNTLRMIHQVNLTTLNLNSFSLNTLYQNYATKMRKRYEEYRNVYSNNDMYPNVEYTYRTIMDELILYESRNEGRVGVIHGDPVFTNIILDKNHLLKFIDMRGKVGDVCTIYGDVYYDFAKIYQSIIGYDCILMNKQINFDYKNSLIELFKSNFTETEMKNIITICNSLLFTLIPLHNNDKCADYYKLIQLETIGA